MSVQDQAIALSIFLLAVAGTIVTVIKPPRIPVLGPHFLRGKPRWAWHQIELGFETPPVLGVFALMAFQIMSPRDVALGIIGDDTIQPYSVLILFVALAYICVALDQTGLFSFIALRIASAAGSSGRRLLVYYYILASFVTLFTSNDIVILTLSPIVCYFCKITNADPLPYLLAEYFAANLWSSLLYTGNPTNIIVAQAFDMEFVPFSYWSGLPTIGAGIMCLVMIFVVFHHRIPTKLIAAQVNASNLLVDPTGAIFGSVVLVACLIALALSAVFNAPMWVIALAAALLVFFRGLIVLILQRFPLSDTVAFIPFHSAQSKQPNSFWSVLMGVPWRCAPFILGMFILVAGLRTTGCTQLFAQGLVWLIGDSFIMAIIVMTVVGLLVCNILSNQPMTILLTEVMISPAFMQAMSPKLLAACNFSVIIASNLGPNFTLIGALAGMMWSKILGDKGVRITYFQFLRYAMLTQLPVVAISCVLLALSSRFAV